MGVDNFMRDSVVNRSLKVQYELKRKKNRRRIALRVTDESQVVVSAPLRTSREVIDRFVESKSDWIAQRLLHVQSLPQRLEEHTWSEGDRFLLLGEEVSLHLVRAADELPPPALEGSVLTIHLSPRSQANAIRKSVLAWYNEFGLALYRPLVEKWCDQLGVKTAYTLSMATYPKRMGSCSQKGELRFALRSVMLPLAVIDYLALHEVAHLLHFNHGISFKRTLTLYMPDWQERQRSMGVLRLRTSSI